MAFYCQNMLEMALILAAHDPIYDEIAFKFLENFIWIAYAMDKVGEHGDDMWDEEDGFYYDVLRLPNGEAFRLKVRSMVGLLPSLREHDVRAGHGQSAPEAARADRLFRKRHPEVIAHVAPSTEGFVGYAGRRLLSPLTRAKLERILVRLLDEKEFLGPYGIRSVSRHHLENPAVVHAGGQEFRVQYLPAESNNGMFGGNSNWRGPIWMPVNVLLIRGLLNFYAFYGTTSRWSARPARVTDDSVRRGEGDLTAPLRDLPARPERPPAGPRRLREVPERPALARSHPLL
jgi:hypothetical protein